jgi:hypothetical protein
LKSSIAPERMPRPPPRRGSDINGDYRSTAPVVGRQEHKNERRPTGPGTAICGDLWWFA